MVVIEIVVKRVILDSRGKTKIPYKKTTLFAISGEFPAKNAKKTRIYRKYGHHMVFLMEFPFCYENLFKWFDL